MFRFNSRVMNISDECVVHRLIHPEVFRCLHLSQVTLEQGTLQCIRDTGERFAVTPSITQTDSGIERHEFNFPTGRMRIERDGLELLAEVFYSAGCPERKVLRCALRDRQLDGTSATSPLSSFPNTHEATNKLPHPDLLAAELSIYCYDPERYLPPGEMLDFIMGLDKYIYTNFEPQTFFRLWTKAFESSDLAPWQPAPPLKGVAQHFVENAGKVLTEVGYHRMDAVAGWYNAVVFFIEKMGFQFTYGEHQAAFAALQAALKQKGSGLKRPLNLREQSWLVALQSIPAKFIPEQLRLGVRWINTPTYTDYVARVHRDLFPFPEDERMKQLILPALFQSTQGVSTLEAPSGLPTTPIPEPDMARLINPFDPHPSQLSKPAAGKNRDSRFQAKPRAAAPDTGHLINPFDPPPNQQPEDLGPFGNYLSNPFPHQPVSDGESVIQDINDLYSRRD